MESTVKLPSLDKSSDYFNSEFCLGEECHEEIEEFDQDFEEIKQNANNKKSIQISECNEEPELNDREGQGEESEEDDDSHKQHAPYGPFQRIQNIFLWIWLLFRQVIFGIHNFCINSVYFLRKCTYPDVYGKITPFNLLLMFLEFITIAKFMLHLILIAGGLAYLIKLAHVPLNDILVALQSVSRFSNHRLAAGVPNATLFE